MPGAFASIGAYIRFMGGTLGRSGTTRRRRPKTLPVDADLDEDLRRRPLLREPVQQGGHDARLLDAREHEPAL